MRHGGQAFGDDDKFGHDASMKLSLAGLVNRGSFECAAAGTGRFGFEGLGHL
jgi:hypothetical protein